MPCRKLGCDEACEACVKGLNEKISDYSKNLFWDVNFDDIDFEKNAPYVIHRVLEYGSFDDWKHILALYGKERIGEIAVNFRSLEPTAMSFVSMYYTPTNRKIQMLHLETIEPATLVLLRQKSEYAMLSSYYNP